jgi:hypothetical protein
LQKSSPSKPVGHKKGLRLRAFKLKPKPKSKIKDKPFLKRASCLDSEGVPGHIPRSEGAGSQASPPKALLAFGGSLEVPLKEGPALTILSGVFRYDEVAPTRPKLSEHVDSLILVSPEPCAPVSLGLNHPPRQERSGLMELLRLFSVRRWVQRFHQRPNPSL